VSRQAEPHGDPEDNRPPEPAGHIGTTGPGPLVGFGLTGLVLGWLVRPVSIRVNDSAPTVGWLPVLALFFVALIVASVAWSTYRTFQRDHSSGRNRSFHRERERIEPQQAVNRLVLAKSCALAGAMVGAGYLGYALSWLGLADAELAEQRMLQSLLAGLAGMLIVVGSLLLERACRVRGDDDRDLR
jgi:hypothetical protein